MSSYRPWIVQAAKYGVGVIALVWLLRTVDLDRVLSAVAEIDISILFLVVVVTLVGLAARFYTWYSLFTRFAPTTFRAAVNTDLIVNFINQLLPSRLSGRAVAPVVVHDESGLSFSESVAIAGVHTGLYAILYGVVATIGLVVGLQYFSTPLVLVLALSTGAYLAAGFLVLVSGINLHVVEGTAEKLTGVERVPLVGSLLSELVERLPDFSTSSADSFRTLSYDMGTVARYTVGWITGMVVAPGMRVLLLLSALGSGFEPLALLPVYLITAYSVTLLPLTPGGIGVTEATATAVFVALGVPSSLIVPVVFLDRFLGVYLPALAGWYPSLRTDFSGFVSE